MTAHQLDLPAAPTFKGQKLKSLTAGRSENFRLDPFHMRPDPALNKRTDFKGVPELAMSMLLNGQTDPITVRRGPEGEIFVTFGERRWRAAIHIRKTLASDESLTAEQRAAAAAFHLRCQSEPPHTTRKDRLFRLLEENSGHEFTLLEKARAYEDLLTEDPDLTEAELARRSQTSRQAVNQALSLTRFGAPQLLQLVEQEKLSASLAGEIIRQHKDDHDAQLVSAKAALDAAAAAGKSAATPKHLPKTSLNVEYVGRQPAAPGANGIFTEPSHFTLTGCPDAWKVRTFRLMLAEHAGSYFVEHDVSVRDSGTGGLPNANFPAEGAMHRRDAWMLALWSALASAPARKLKPAQLEAIEEAFTARITERHSDLPLTVTRPTAGEEDTDDDSPPWDDTTDTTSDLFTEAQTESGPRFIYQPAEDETVDSQGFIRSPRFLRLHDPDESWGINHLLLSLALHEGRWIYGYHLETEEWGTDLPCDVKNVGGWLDKTGKLGAANPGPCSEHGAWGQLYFDIVTADEGFKAIPIEKRRQIHECLRQSLRATTFPSSTDHRSPITDHSSEAPRFDCFKITDRPAGQHEMFRLALVNPPAGVKLLHLSWGYPTGKGGERMMGGRVELEQDDITATAFYPVGDPKLAGIDAMNLHTGLDSLIKALFHAVRKHPSAPQLETLDPAPDHLRYFGFDSEIEPEEIAWVDPDAKDLAPADPSAFDRIKGAADTNRDGSGVGPGSGGFVSSDKRLKSLEEILNKIAEGPHDEARLTTAELVLNYINNEADGTTLRTHLKG